MSMRFRDDMGNGSGLVLAFLPIIGNNSHCQKNGDPLSDTLLSTLGTFFLQKSYQAITHGIPDKSLPLVTI